MSFQTLTRKLRALAGSKGLSDSYSPARKAGSTQALARASGVTVEGLEGRTLMSTYYLSPSGNDANAGTSIAAPWKTINKVNTLNLHGGDKVYFQAGQSFSGNLKFNEYDSGAGLTNPITISTYGGTSKAVINAGTGSGIYVWKTGGFAISNLKIVGSGTTNNGNGIEFTNPMGGGVDFAGPNINNVDATGFLHGVLIQSINGTSGYNDTRITNSSFYENAHAGIKFTSFSVLAHRNVYISYVSAYSNYGKGSSGQTGNGILLAGVDGGTVEHCVAFNNGYKGGDGNVGFFAAYSNKITFQYNESYNNISRGGRDGGGFDFDYQVSNSVMQYNYSHGNSGNGLLLAHAPTDNLFTNDIIRYNISENDGRGPGDAGIFVWGKVLNSQIYNNTVFVSPSTHGVPKAIKISNVVIPHSFVSNLSVRNNIFIATGGTRLVEVTNGQLVGAKNLVFQGNCYYTYGGKVDISWGGKYYGSLSAFRTGSKQEILNGIAVGTDGDPKLVNPGKGGTVGDINKLSLLAAYRLQGGSYAVDRAINLTTFGVNPGTRDLWGTPLPQGKGYDIGADESPAGTAPAPGLPPVTNPPPVSTGSLTSADIGAVGKTGSTTLANGVYTVSGSGSDIFNNKDSFRFVSTALQGNGSIVANLTGLSSANAWAKSGVMIRESNAVDSKYAATFITPGHGAQFQSRSNTNGLTNFTNQAGVTAPEWVKLTRVGNLFSSYSSSDGSTWKLIGSQTITMNASVLIGLAVTAHDATQLNKSTFSNVSIV